MNISIIISGFGGQGVLSMGKLICYAADSVGKNATFFPSYGGEQRGGTCNCTVIISDEEIGTPVVNKADYIIIMNEPSYDRFKSSISSKGTLLVNESQVKNSGDLKGVNIVKIRSDDIAVELGNRLASNMVVLGAFTSVSKFVDAEVVKETIKSKMANKKEYLESNMKAFDIGFEVLEQQCNV